MTLGTKIELRPWTPLWAELYDHATKDIRSIIGTEPRLEHVGSTSVWGLAAKPILDILVGVCRQGDLEIIADLFSAAGFRKGLAAPGVGRAAFMQRAASERLPALNLHLAVVGDPQWTDLLTFPERLRAEPQLARRYEALKRILADRHGDDLDAYTAGKSEFVAQVLECRL